MDKTTPWEVPYRKAFVESTLAELKKTAIFDAAKAQAVDDKTAELMGRLEVFTLLSVGSMAHEASQNIATVALQIHNDLNNRTAYLGREVGRIWQAMPAQSLGTTLFNSVAGSTIGQRLGLTPIAAPVPEDFNPVPQAPNRHKNPTTPPVLSNKLATITGGGGTISIADPDPKATDQSFVVNITFGAGSTAAIGDTVVKVSFGSAYDKIPVVIFSTAGSFAPAPFTIANLTTAGFEIKSNNAISGSLSFAVSFVTSPSYGDSTY